MESSWHLTHSSMVVDHPFLLDLPNNLYQLLHRVAQVRIDDVKPSGFKRLIHFVYNSRCLR